MEYGEDWNEDYNVEEDSEVEDMVSSDGDVDLMFVDKCGKDVLKSGNDNTEEGEEEDSIKLNDNLTLDQLLYDPVIDEENEKWMKRKRGQNSKDARKSQSDAMLSCPACLTTVCVDCQRHDVYKTQFRAMFVMNCHVIAHEFLRYERKNVSKKQRRKHGPGKLVACEHPVQSCETGNSDSVEVFNPVKCDVCLTELAVFDHDEIYHFFNVLESIA